MSEHTLSPQVQEVYDSYPRLSNAKIIAIIVFLALMIWSITGLDFKGFNAKGFEDIIFIEIFFHGKFSSQQGNFLKTFLFNLQTCGFCNMKERNRNMINYCRTT